MRKSHLSVVALAALVTFGVGASTLTAQPRRALPPTGPLYNLNERDLAASGESGCECSFSAGRNTLIQVIGNALTVRTRAGRQDCRISDAQFSALSNGRGNAACAGLRLSLRPTGRVTTHMESDSAEGPAALTVSQGRARRTIAGRYGCAC
jgi:hypothetical protein